MEEVSATTCAAHSSPPTVKTDVVLRAGEALGYLFSSRRSLASGSTCRSSAIQRTAVRSGSFPVPSLAERGLPREHRSLAPINPPLSDAEIACFLYEADAPMVYD
ncbi:unnamed protein product [Rangifer tarandus platyrhynchus]|uniref:Uncharacterized protein n=1 Tax=Rangifer tarandus platyrhynchus TaxID=3082113 RepID=A0AC59YPZ5_RANTA